MASTPPLAATCAMADAFRPRPRRCGAGRIIAVILPLIAIALVGLPGAARAQSASQPDTRTSGGDNAAQYCRNIADAAADARFARQKEALAAMEKDIEARIARLEAKRAEYQDWLQRRENFLGKADETLVAVISQMRPDAAAAQMAAMNEDMAAALLSKLTPRVASSILNEFEPARAARLTTTLVGLSRRAQGARPEPDARVAREGRSG